MSRAAFAALAVVAAAGLLARSVTPVAACTCVPFSAENAAIRADLVVIGTVTDEIWRQGDSSPNNDCGATGGQSGAILVERYIEGSGGERIEFFNEPGKSYCRKQVNSGERYLMMLYGGSSTFGVDSVALGQGGNGDEIVRGVELALEIANRDTEHWLGVDNDSQVAGRSDTDEPWEIVVAATLAVVALAGLLVAAFALTRRRQA